MRGREIFLLNQSLIGAVNGEVEHIRDLLRLALIAHQGCQGNCQQEEERRKEWCLR